jgi:hypothetical protein
MMTRLAMTAANRLQLAVPLAITTLLLGCGGEMKVAPVSGIVTLDGKPLDRASVVFKPEEGGRPSFGVTDSKGRFSLAYSMNEDGAEVGPCTVTISTKLQSESTDGNYRENAPRAAERVPARYAKSPLKVTVEAKSNEIELGLTSQR